tara:strand:- start:1039 stop:1353 length:315 start_codon:yes stop_codon:yes gene_type:complete
VAVFKACNVGKFASRAKGAVLFVCDLVILAVIFSSGALETFKSVGGVFSSRASCACGRSTGGIFSVFARQTFTSVVCAVLSRGAYTTSSVSSFIFEHAGSAKDA